MACHAPLLFKDPAAIPTSAIVCPTVPAMAGSSVSASGPWGWGSWTQGCSGIGEGLGPPEVPCLKGERGCWGVLGGVWAVALGLTQPNPMFPSTLGFSLFCGFSVLLSPPLPGSAPLSRFSLWSFFSVILLVWVLTVFSLGLTHLPLSCASLVLLDLPPAGPAERAPQDLAS